MLTGASGCSSNISLKISFIDSIVKSPQSMDTSSVFSLVTVKEDFLPPEDPFMILFPLVSVNNLSSICFFLNDL